MIERLLNVELLKGKTIAGVYYQQLPDSNFCINLVLLRKHKNTIILEKTSL